MNKLRFKREALERMPHVKTAIASGFYRHDIVNLLSGNDNIGIELGVANGSLSKRLLESNRFKLLFGVDIYSDLHDTDEYKNALTNIGIENTYKLFRLSFDDAVSLFPDSYFDFIYIDGFAHTGEEGGKTLSDWFDKLKLGGILSGDDYHENWPLVMWAVNHFAVQLDTHVSLTDKLGEDPYSLYPSWFIEKTQTITNKIELNPRLVEIATKERERINKTRLSNHARIKRAALKLHGRFWK